MRGAATLAGVGVVALLLDGSGGQSVLPDPAGGFFDAAGDFDRLIPLGVTDLPLLGCVDPHGTTSFTSDVMPELITEIDRLLRLSRDGPERRGLDRLRTLATECTDMPDGQLVFVGD